MRLPTFPSRRLANRTTDSLSLSAPTATPIAFLTATQTFTSPTPTITVLPSGTAPKYPSSDEEFSDWDSEDDEDLTWDDDIDGVTAEQLGCKKGGEDDSDDDSDDEDSEHKDARPPPHGQPQPQPSGETPVGNGTITCISSLAPIAAPSTTSTSLVLPSSAIPTTIVTSSIISSTTTTGTFNSSPSYTSSSSLPTSSLSSTPIPISDSISTFVSPTPLSTLYTLTASTGAIFGTPTIAIVAATSSAAPGGNSGNNKTAAAGIAVGATAGVVFIASAAFILARIRLKRNKAASEASSTPSTPGAGDFPSPYMTRAVNFNAPPSPNPFTMSPTRRIMTNSELLDNVIAAAYDAEIAPNANRPVASTHASMMPPATVPGPAGAVYGYGYDDAESEVDDGMGPSRLSAALRVLVDPVAPVVVEQAAGNDTVMMWMGGMASPSLMDSNAPASPLPVTPGAEEIPVGFGGLGVGMSVEHLDEPSFYDIDGVRIPSAYASERMSGVTGSERPDSPWDYEGYGRTRLAPPGGYI